MLCMYLIVVVTLQTDCYIHVYVHVVHMPCNNVMHALILVVVNCYRLLYRKSGKLRVNYIRVLFLHGI